MASPLSGKTAVVTGGSRGIGAAIVLRLARDGANVAFSYASSKDRAEQVVAQVEALGRKALAYKADQAIVSEVQAFIKKAHETFGSIDILVNSAGVFITGPVDDPAADVAGFERQFDINVKGVAAAVRAAAPLMTEGGRIVSIGTSGADHMPFPGTSDYIATKGAVAAYTRGWARDLGPRGITVNLVQPGPINTDMNPEDGPFAEMMKGFTALRRYGRSEDVAAAVAFLASPEANYITGATLNVDGGISA